MLIKKIIKIYTVNCIMQPFVMLLTRAVYFYLTYLLKNFDWYQNLLQHLRGICLASLWSVITRCTKEYA